MIIEPPFYRLYNSKYSVGPYPSEAEELAGAVRGGTDWDVRCYNADYAPVSDPMRIEHLTNDGVDDFRRGLGDLRAPIWDEVCRAICEYRPGVVGVVAGGRSFVSGYVVSRIVKIVRPDATVILLGPHALESPREALDDCPWIDVAVNGDGEAGLINLLWGIEHDLSLVGIPGILLRRKRSRRSSTRPRRDGSGTGISSPTEGDPLDPDWVWEQMKIDRYPYSDGHGAAA